MRTLNANRDRAQALIRAVAAHLPRQMEDDPARHALDYAIMTAPDSRDPVLLARLDAVAGRALGQS